MPSNYDKIRRDNLIEYGQGTRHLAFLGQLYTERTHFIFELIQNAEDAGGSRIRFRLHNDRLEVENDGRPFNELDVRGVCGVGEGTNSQDLTKIGKFGIGFKSIYAYTTNPEVHSGDEHFLIEHYVRPHSCAVKQTSKDFTTLFVLPFNEPKIAFDQIRNALLELSPRTILFLRNIESLEIQCDGTQQRDLLRIRDSGNPADVYVEDTGQKVEEWKVFEHPVGLEQGISVKVEIGFKFSLDDGVRRFAPLNQSPLVVFFPTEKPTNLGFLIQGPYRTTPARDNIPKDDLELTRFGGHLMIWG